MLFSNLRQAGRQWLRVPAVAAIAILSIAVGTGAAAVVFAAVKTALIDPLPYSHPETLVQIRTNYPGAGNPRQDWVSWNDMHDVARENHSFTAVATYHYSVQNLAGDAHALPEALYGLRVSAELLPMLGVSPLFGRHILPEETQPGRDREMILSYGLWQRRFHADPSILGRSVQVDGHDCRIIGVMPETFDFPLRLATTVSTPSRHMDFWVPDAVDPAQTPREQISFGAIARLRPGVSLAQAQQDLNAIAAHLALDYPKSNEFRTLGAALLRDRTLGFAQTGLLLLGAAALVFLLIGCTNVAHLLLARALARQREIAIRSALGAGRARILRQVLTENTLLALLGGFGGFGLTLLAWNLLPAVTPMSIPRLAAARADGAVLAFALAAAVVTGLAAGLPVAWRIASGNLSAALHASGARGVVGGRRDRLQSLLLTSEIAVTVVLVVLGGALTGSFVRLLKTDPGFAPGRILASIIVPAGDRYARDAAARTALFRQILESVRRLPDIDSAGTVDALPFSGENNGGRIAATESQAAEPGSQPVAEIDRVSAGYLETMGVHLVAGRLFREADQETARDTAVVNDQAARQFWPAGNAVGSRLCINCRPGQQQHWKTIIGVVSSVRHAALDQAPGPQVYLSGDALASAIFLVVRTNRPAAGLSQAIRRTVASVDPAQPVFLSATMATLVGDSLSDRRFILVLLAVTAALALVLSAAGIYGVVSYAASRRAPELGVRIALGASPRQLHFLVFRQGMAPATAGIAAGLLAAVPLGQVLRHSIVGLRADDPAPAAIALSLVILTAAFACWLPARRATRIDPLAALRRE